MAAELGEEFNPERADYAYFLGFPYTQEQAHSAMVTGALLTMAAFTRGRIGCFLSYRSPIIARQIVDGMSFYGLTQAEAIGLAAAMRYAAATGTTMSAEMMGVALRSMYASPGFAQYFTSISTLMVYNFSINQSDYDDFADYMNSMGFDCYEYPGPAGIQIFCME